MESREGVRAGRCGDFLALNKASWEPEDLGKAELSIDAKEGVRERADCDILGSKLMASSASGKMEDIVPEAVKEGS
jgi:hypothetical protein